MESQTWLVHLSQAQCEQLLNDAIVGRVGVVVDGRPEVFPVCHVYHDGCVLFPTNEGTKMHAALAWPYVAFEADGIEPDGDVIGGIRGWSVMVTGRAEEVIDSRLTDEAMARRWSPWKSSADMRWIRIIPDQITGRRIDATPGDLPDA